MGNCFELQPAFNILTKRPLLLHLCPTEPRPTNRVASVTAPTPMIIYDMPMMSKFVADFYQQKCQKSRACKQSWLPQLPEISREAQEKGLPGTQGTTGTVMMRPKERSQLQLRSLWKPLSMKWKQWVKKLSRRCLEKTRQPQS